MHLLTKPTAAFSLLLLIALIAWLAWSNTAQVERIEYVSGLVGGSDLSLDAGSGTGFESGLRRLILPEGSNETYEELLQTGQMIAAGTWRLRHVDYDNAPFGREVASPSLSRWWLALLAGVDHLVTARPPPLSVERAGLWGGPVLHLILLLAAGITVARRFGILASSLAVILLGAAFPVADAFLAARPAAGPLSLVFALWSVLPLLTRLSPNPVTSPVAGSSASGRSPGRTGFLVAGLFGGLGLWNNVSFQVPVLIGIAAGAIALAWLGRRNPSFNRDSAPRPSDWRIWSLGGAAVSVAATLVESFPGHLQWLSLQENHPVYAIGWVCGGELLYRVESSLRGRHPLKGTVGRLLTSLSIVGVLLVPGLMALTRSRGFLPTAPRLTGLPETAAPASLLDGIAREGFPLTTIAMLLPLVLLLISLLFHVRRLNATDSNPAALMTWGPAGVATLLALITPGWWPMVAILTVPVLVASVAGLPRVSKFPLQTCIWIVGAMAVSLPGIGILSSRAAETANEAVSEAEMTSLLERDLSHWLARQVGPTGANVLAPPSLTVSLIFHGGLKGLSTPFPGNQEGFAAAVRIAAATSPDEARALAERRKLTHIIIPSWDGFLDEYARIGATDPGSTLIAMLHRWLAPRWLAPVPYRMPLVEGFREDFVAVFKTVEVQDNATALSRLAEYFLEMGQTDGAIAVGQALERSFPGDLNALIARAQIAIARRDPALFRSVTEQIVTLLESGAGIDLAWNRRVSLSIVLARFNAGLLVREQLEICLEEADDDHIRSLSTLSLFRFVSLITALNLEFDDPDLHSLAIELLPAGMKSELEGRGLESP